MKWVKLGRLYQLEGLHPKLYSHAANPLAIHLHGDIYRIYFSARDEYNRSSVGAVDVDLIRRTVIHQHTNPFFTHGPEDSFYSHGVSIGNTYSVGDRRYMLFMGWKNDEENNWYGRIGRLRVSPDGILSLDGESPFMPLDGKDSLSMSYPWVFRFNGKFHMCYGSTLTWDAGNGEMLHVLNFAESENGHEWKKNSFSVPYEVGVAQAFSRPSIYTSKRSKTLNMWFSYRTGNGQSYRIGRAVSVDGRSWELKLNEGGLSTSATGWDSEMVEYPFVLEHKGETFMLYNGNQFGLTGFGLAQLEK